jgi:AcrR family transcriptional regulator
MAGKRNTTARRRGSGSADLDEQPRPAGTQVSEVQRVRLLRAAAEVVGELGYAGMSVARVTVRAGVSRRTFYDLFEDREDCFLAVFEEAIGRVTMAAGDAFSASDERWRVRVRRGLGDVLELLDEDPGLRALTIVEALGAGPRVLARRALVLAALERIVDGGRAELDASAEPPPLTAEGIVGAVLAVIHARLLAAENPALSELLNPFMGMIVLPYLGPAAARGELEHPTPEASPRPRGSRRGLLDGLEVRLTYRTLRVLEAIAASPGASNRAVADHAGVADQGQISKLLGRLGNLGLIHNMGEGQVRGEANSWALTSRGREVEQAIRAAAPVGA